MKKLFRNLMLMAVAAMGVASCADVPAPFVEPGGGESGGDDTPTVELKGTGTATDPYNVAAALNLITALADDVQSDEQYYVTGIVSEIKEYSTQYGNASFVITDEGTGNELIFWRGYYLNNEKFTAETNPIAIGDSVVIYGYYVNYKGNTPETVQNKAYVYYHKSNGTPTETLNTPIVPEEGNLLVNGNFEGWTNGLPTHWASSSSASSATLDYSTDAHGGNYAVVVKGASTNKRLAYKEMTLAAGDYTMSFYAKAVSGEASVRPGYAVVVGGSLSGDSYQYADYVNGITNAEWMQVTHSFTLEASTTLCLVVMNPKSTGTDVLIDDFKLTTTNGGVEEGGGEETPGGEVKGDGSLENPFNAAAALEYTAALAADQATSEKFYIKGIVCESSKMDISTQYKNATFHITEDGSATGTQFLIFRTKGLNGADITSEDDVQVGDEVIVYASLVNYKGNTPETAQGGIIYAQKRNGVDLNPGEGGDNGEGEGGGNEGGDVPAGTNIFENGDFEQWVDGAPLNWKSASSAGNVSVEQSTDAHGGSYAVSMVGVEKSNKRLAYKETTLAAGTYKFSFYAKGTVAGSKCQTRPGYVPMKADGTIDSSNYKYGSYVTLSATDWTLVEHEFTLDAETTICTVIMSPKTSNYHDAQNILVDDASLVKIK